MILITPSMQANRFECIFAIFFYRDLLMTDIGRINRLKVLKTLDFGVYLDGRDLGESLMPIRYVPVT